MATTDATTASNTASSNNMDTTSLRKIKIQSKDGEIYEIDDKIIDQSSTIKSLVDSIEVAGFIIPMQEVSKSILGPVIEFCEHHKNDPKPELNEENDEDDFNKDQYEPKKSDDIDDWDKNFISRFTVEDGTLFDMTMAANYMGIKTLLAVCCKTIANMVRGKGSNEVREMFKISYDPPGEGLNAPNTPDGSVSKP